MASKTPPPPTIPDAPAPGSMSAVAYEELLVSEGWESIGSGAGGRVYRFPGAPVVLKVSEADVGYVAFASYAIANPSPCLPKMQLLHSGSNWSLYEIEVLDPLSDQNATDVDAWWSAWVSARKAKAPPPQPALWSNAASALAAVAIASGSTGFDMKRENAMQRGNNVVFTDPLAP